MAELMKQGRQKVAAQIKREINSGRGTRQLESVLDVLLNSQTQFDSDKSEWLLWLIAGGDPPDDFMKILQQNNTSEVCGLVWNAQFIAYRCRDCAISPCMSLCADCFQNGDHEGHDFNMFRSQAGGACDCGDDNVMRKQGFCSSHGSDRKIIKKNVPEEMITLAKYVIPRLVLKIHDDLQIARNENVMYMLPPGLTELLRFLSKISEADILRNIISASILSSIDKIMAYANRKPVLTTAWPSSKLQPRNSTASGHPLVSSVPSDPMDTDFVTGQASSGSINNTTSTRDYFDFLLPQQPSNALKFDSTSATFLDFFMHILVQCEFPSCLATFLLQLFPDMTYKIAFTRSFCRHYKAIGTSLCQSAKPDQLSNNLVHVSVQLFSSDILAKMMVVEENILNTLVTVLIDMLNMCAEMREYETSIESIPGHDTSSSVAVACCENLILSKHCYWPVTSDLINVLSHKDVVRIFLEDKDLIDQWMSLVTLLTGMNLNVRRIIDHIEFEPRTYITSFSVEFESVVAVMWELIRGCVKLGSNGDCYVKMVQATEKALKQWYSNVPFMPKKSTATFHLSLHRYLSLFASQAIVRFGMDQHGVLPPIELLAKWMEYPLRSLVAFYEIKAGLWVLNGFQIRGQAQSYVQCHFCNSMADLDIFFLQMATSKLDPDYFLELLLKRFSLTHWFQFGDRVSDQTRGESDYKEKLMVEGFLNLILTLLSQRVFSGASDLDQCKKDVAALLCVANKTHSQLSDSIPTRPGESSDTAKNFEVALREMADFKAPNLDTDAMQQGKYIPKDCVWDDHFDYSHVQHRCYSTADHQTALERFTNNMQQRGLTTHTRCWPPAKDLSPIHHAFRGIFRLLQSDTLHKILVFIIYKAVKSVNEVTEPMLMTAVHLLRLAVRSSPTSVSKGFISQAEEPDRRIRNANKCLDFLEKHAGDAKMLYGTGERELLELNKPLYDQINEGLKISPDSHIADVVTILQHEIFASHQHSIYKTLLSYTDESQEMQFHVNPVKHIEHLLSITSEDRYQLIKRLVAHWKKCSKNDDVSVTSYAFCKQRAHQNKSFPLLLHFLVTDYDQLFKVHSVPKNTPATVFDIKYNTGSIIENAGKDVCGRIDQTDKTSFTSEDGSKVDSDITMTSSEEPSQVGQQENLVSLLVQLVAKLNEGSKSTPVKRSRESESLKEQTAGDGSFHVTELLLSLADSSRVNEELINKLCPSICKRNEVKKKRLVTEDSNEPSKADRRKRAMARQQKILAEFMSKQEVFRDQVVAREIHMDVSECDGNEETTIDNTYDCVICGQTSSSNADRPIGVSVLMQATTVLGHRRKEGDYLELPDKQDKSRNLTCCVFLEKRKSAIIQSFDKVAAGRALEAGVDCGVHVQTCSHYIHIDCHQSYLKSLQEERTRSFDFEQPIFDINKGFFTCPLCRQPCNGVLPILPDSIRKRDSKHAQKEFAESASDVTKLLEKYSEAGSLSLLTAKALEFTVLTASSATFVALLSNALKSDGHPSTALYSDRTFKEKFSILVSTFRSCLELEYIELCNGSKQLGSKRSCLASLYEMLQFHSQCLDGPAIGVWRELVCDETQLHCSSSNDSHSDVPLLFKDAFSILLQFVLSWPTWIIHAHFRCLLKAVYNMVIVQALFILSFKIQKDEARTFEKIFQDRQATSTLSAKEILSIACASISHIKSRFGDHEEESGISQSLLSPQAIELKIQEFCLPFLRMAAMLSNVIFETEIQLVKDHNEFDILLSMLGLTEKQENSDVNSHIAATDCMSWSHSHGSSVVKRWCDTTCQALGKTNIQDLSLLPLNQVWASPRLLILPELYDSLFQYYRKQKCHKCGKIPSDPTLCLVCGAFLCFRSPCCSNLQGVYECVQHSIDCGCGTGIFLLVLSSAILVIRAERAVLWGSVYLDSFGEEDRELKRGKPLFLSKQRYERLEQQWLSHSFDRTCKRWGWHSNKF